MTTAQLLYFIEITWNDMGIRNMILDRTGGSMADDLDADAKLEIAEYLRKIRLAKHRK